MKLVDFGIAKRLEAPGETITVPGRIVGTPAYMAPELVTSPSHVGPPADIYSLGVLLVELLTGHRTTELAHLPHPLRPVLRRMLDPSPGARRPWLELALDRRSIGARC